MAATSSGKISLALSASKPTSTSRTNGIKRPHAALNDHNDADSDDEETEHGRRQQVSHFDRAAGGAIDEARPAKAKKEDKVLVIQPLKNRDWREAAAAGRGRRVQTVRGTVDGEGRESSGSGGAEGTGEKKEKEVVYGLNVRSRETDDAASGHPLAAVSSSASAEKKNHTEPAQPPPNVDPPNPDSKETPTDDSHAIAALLSTGPNQSSNSTLVLPAPTPAALTEDEAFTRDFRSAPAVPSLADYDRVPVEHFGAALLRGMGWKDGEGIGSARGKKAEETKLPVRRAALLGIGAKDDAGGGVAGELGAWGRGAAGAKKKVEVAYNPVLLRDKRTGELLTEEEVEKRKVREEREGFEREFEREERRRREKGDKGRGERDREGRDGSGKRDKPDERDRRRYDSDEEDRRRREKERRRKERDGGDYRDRERSKRHDGDRERRHDSDRERRHDSDRERRHDSDRERRRERHREHRR